MSESVDKRTASQKIEDLEKVVTVLYQATANLEAKFKNLSGTQQDMVLVKETLRLLNKKTEAIIQSANPETGITVASVSAIVVKMNVEDLTAQVASYVANGHIVATDTVAANSYLVAEEYNADGTLANPRIQFRLDSQDQATQDALMGKKAGDTASFGENKFSAKILEVYSIQEPAAADAAAPVTETPAEAAPAEVSPAEAAPALTPLPEETPVAQFVPSEPDTMATA